MILCAHGCSCNSCASKSRAFRKRPIRPLATGGSDWNAHSNRGRGGREAERKVSTGKGEWRGLCGCCGGCPCRDEEEEGFVAERVQPGPSSTAAAASSSSKEY